MDIKLTTFSLVFLLILNSVDKTTQIGFFKFSGSLENASENNETALKQLHQPSKEQTNASINVFSPKLLDEVTLKRQERAVEIGSEVVNLTVTKCQDSSDDFPGFLTENIRVNGGFMLAFLIGCYCFTFLAIICDHYFLPCVERICEVLDLSHDVAAATFMSIATSAPELFVNIIGTFITESDLGLGTIVGSSLFNALGVAALGGLAASTPIQLDWWPLTRDVIIYIFAILLLVGITWDGKIFWYEGLALFIIYFLYFVAMFNNVRISNFLKKIFRRTNKVEPSECAPEKHSAEKRPSVAMSDINRRLSNTLSVQTISAEKRPNGEINRRLSNTLSVDSAEKRPSLEVSENSRKTSNTSLARNNNSQKRKNSAEKNRKISSTSTVRKISAEKRHSASDRNRKQSVINNNKEHCNITISVISNNNLDSAKNKEKLSNNLELKPPEPSPVRRRSGYGSYMQEDSIKRYVEKMNFIEENKGAPSPFVFPHNKTLGRKIFFVICWPLRLISFLLIPDPVLHPKMFPITFVMCVFFIGINSYIVSWMISVTGSQFHIPDTVLGLTFLAAGGCLPEGTSITIMSRRGEGSMGVSNSLGANTMNILMSLGLPWFLKTITMGMNNSSYITIVSGSIEYTILSLIGAASLLYLTLYFNKFKLRRRVGYILIPIYLVFITMAILSEIVFFKNDCVRV